MEIDLQKFISINKRVIIWTTFFVLLFLLRRLFGLLFLTFILGFIFFNITHWLESKTRLNRRLLIVVTYVVFLFIITTLAVYIVPKLGSESKLFIQQIPETIDNFQRYLDRLATQQERLAPVFNRIKESLTFEALVGYNQEAILATVVKFFNSATTFFSYFLVGIIFSFLVLFDYPVLRERARSLQETRLRDIYIETVESVIQFALVVGEVFQAQILIACINTGLTALGLYILDIHPIIVLSVIVFFAGLVPVLGTFISSVPIFLLAFNSGGIKLVFYALTMIFIIHLIEAYILNPRIVSAVLRINPVLTLIILYIGGSLFGLWGVFLGVPVAVFIFRHAIQRPTPPAPREEALEAEAASE
ncbi:MAG: AI-2E family transporter [Deltaproteobacteria bacterium]|nr:AI-2E family transporter [Deltaproteobacteria bacterium]MBW2086777.1 AI-2E family transporter [Deltaproteobacteria bacterium]